MVEYIKIDSNTIEITRVSIVTKEKLESNKATQQILITAFDNRIVKIQEEKVAIEDKIVEIDVQLDLLK